MINGETGRKQEIACRGDTFSDGSISSLCYGQVPRDTNEKHAPRQTPTPHNTHMHTNTHTQAHIQTHTLRQTDTQTHTHKQNRSISSCLLSLSILLYSFLSL